MPIVTKRLKGVITFGLGIDTVLTPLSGGVDISKTVPFIQVKNVDGESTYGGSLGNVLFEPEITSGGAFLTIRRISNFQQSIEVHWSILEFSNANVYSGLFLKSSTEVNITIPSVDITKSFSILNIRSNRAWASDMREACISHRITSSNNLLVKGIITDNTIYCRWYVVELDDVVVTSISGNATGLSYEATLPSAVDLSKTYLFTSIEGLNSSPVMDGRNMKTARFSANNKVEYRSSADYVSGYSSYIIETQNSLVQRGSVVMVDTSEDIVLPIPVDPSRGGDSIGGQFGNWGAPIDTYEEESGDFSIVSTLGEDVPTTSLSLRRGERTSLPDVYVDWEVSEFNYQPVQASDRRSGVADGVERGIKRGVI